MPFKDSPHKWLDLTSLFKTVLGEENDLVKIKYFTARVQPTERDPQVNTRQDTYFRALQAHCPEVEIHLGHFLRHRIFAENANPPPNRVEIFKTEEKGSDVNLALHVLNDTWALEKSLLPDVIPNTEIRKTQRIFILSVKCQFGDYMGLAVATSHTV